MGDSVQVHVRATPTNQVSAIRLTIDGAPVPEFGGAETTFNWNTAGLTASSHTLRAEARPTSAGWVPGPALLSNCFVYPPAQSRRPDSGDLDQDGDVDIFDYSTMVAQFGKAECGNVADIDGNCKVDILDYNILVTNFGQHV